MNNKMNCELMLTYDNPALRQTGSRNLTGQKMLPTKWGTYMKLVTKYQICVINSCWEKCDEKYAYMFNVYKDQLSRQTGSRNPTGPKTLLRKMWRKISWTDRGKTVYPPPPSGSRGIIIISDISFRFYWDSPRTLQTTLVLHVSTQIYKYNILHVSTQIYKYNTACINTNLQI